ncbi:hypothetical protein GCM10010404_68760 [Nonomuraea africana]
MAAGLSAIGGGAYCLATELTCGPTREETKRAGERELALRWRHWTAGQLFPDRFTHDGKESFAHRIGIAPESSCEQALDDSATKAVSERGCLKVLRATYADPTSTILSTLAIVVMKDTAAAKAALAAGKWQSSGVRPAGISGTLASRFGPGQEQEHTAVSRANYLVFGTGGYADGRPRLSRADRKGFPGFTTNAVDALATVLSKHVPACEVKEIRRYSKPVPTVGDAGALLVLGVKKGEGDETSSGPLRGLQAVRMRRCGHRQATRWPLLAADRGLARQLVLRGASERPGWAARAATARRLRHCRGGSPGRQDGDRGPPERSVGQGIHAGTVATSLAGDAAPATAQHPQVLCRPRAAVSDPISGQDRARRTG